MWTRFYYLLQIRAQVHQCGKMGRSSQERSGNALPTASLRRYSYVLRGEVQVHLSTLFLFHVVFVSMCFCFDVFFVSTRQRVHSLSFLLDLSSVYYSVPGHYYYGIRIIEKYK